jgi:hypothetical protein
MDSIKQDSVTLNECDLYSKWGFGDGDIIREYFYTEGSVLDGLNEKFDAIAPDAPMSLDHLTLIAIVKKYLIPALPYKVNAEEYTTCHNPIRADKWIDEDDEDLYELVGDRSVEVSLADIVKTAHEIFNEHRSKNHD